MAHQQPAQALGAPGQSQWGFTSPGTFQGAQQAFNDEAPFWSVSDMFSFFLMVASLICLGLSIGLLIVALADWWNGRDQ